MHTTKHRKIMPAPWHFKELLVQFSPVQATFIQEHGLTLISRQASMKVDRMPQAMPSPTELSLYGGPSLVQR